MDDDELLDVTPFSRQPGGAWPRLREEVHGGDAPKLGARRGDKTLTGFRHGVPPKKFYASSAHRATERRAGEGRWLGLRLRASALRASRVRRPQPRFLPRNGPARQARRGGKDDASKGSRPKPAAK